MDQILLALLAALAFAFAACGSDDDGPPPAPVAILTAFPSELVPLVTEARIDRTVTIDARVFHIGELAGHPVVLAMTGIGLVNAEETTRTLLDNFRVRAVLVSGVAGSSLRIGDVTVARTWTLADGPTFAADPALLALAEQVAAEGHVVMETCTVRPLAPDEPTVCLRHVPALVVGGSGSSTDSFNGSAFRCTSGDVFGCDVSEAEVFGLMSGRAAGAIEGIDASTITVADMETAAVAREAAARAVPFLAFRATSDGSDDPLDLPGFPAQFFTYYRLAAYNAAAAAIALLESLP